MAKIILYSLNDSASKEAEDLLRKAGEPFEIQPHLFSDTDKPVIRLEHGELIEGMYAIRLYFPDPQRAQ